MTADLRALLADAAPRPWLYRPDEYDDWGYIRADGVSSRPIVALARAGSDADLDEHRRNGTDPYEANGCLIVAAVNTLPALVDERDALAAEVELLRAALTQAASDFHLIALHSDFHAAWKDAKAGRDRALAALSTPPKETDDGR